MSQRAYVLGGKEEEPGHEITVSPVIFKTPPAD